MSHPPSTPPSTPGPAGSGNAPSWGAVPPMPVPPAGAGQPPAGMPTGPKQSRRKAWLTHGATALVSLVIGAGIGGDDSAVLGRVATEAQRYCQTRFLCDKYGLPLPAALATGWDDAPQTDAT